MAKGKTTRNFFDGPNIKLGREIKAERAKTEAEGKRGFIAEINRRETVAPEARKLQAQIDEQSKYRGEDTKAPAEIHKEDFSLDTPADEPNKGFTNQIKFNNWKKDLK